MVFFSFRVFHNLFFLFVFLFRCWVGGEGMVVLMDWSSVMAAPVEIGDGGSGGDR